jgi:hypothetical protein
MMHKRFTNVEISAARAGMLTAMVAGMLIPATAPSQTPAAPAVPHQSGTVKSATANSMTLTTAAGQDYTVSLPDAAKILVVAPGSKDLKSATAGTPTDIAVGDKAIVTGSASDTGSALTATRIILMKSAALAESHAAEDAAWAQGGGGIVKSVDAAAGKVLVASGLKTMAVQTTSATIVRRYSGDSVRFADAQVSTLGLIRPGDQLRVRGTKTPDGSSITADELVTGTFHNYSGMIASIDTTAGTITLKDLKTKKPVTVAVTANSDVRRIPAMLAQRVAMQMKGGAAGGQGAGRPGAGGPPAQGQGAPGAGGPPGGAGADGGGQRAGRAGMDLSQMLSRLPTETVAGLKTGDAVMIVATSPAADSVKSTAVTLLAGVDAILTASPTDDGPTLAPWSMGGGGEPGGGGGGPQ